MNLRSQIRANSLVVSFLLALSAYGSSRVAVHEIPQTADPTAEIGKLEAAIATAATEQVDVPSPKSFRKSSAALREAKESRDEAQDAEVILDFVEEGHAYRGEANDTAKRHDDPGIKIRSEAATASANRLLRISRDAKVTEKKDAESVVLEKELQQDKIAASAAELTTAAADEARQASALQAARDATLDMASKNSDLETQKQAGARLDVAKAKF